MEKIWKSISFILLIISVALLSLYLNYNVEVKHDKENNYPLLDYYSLNFDTNYSMTGNTISDSLYEKIAPLFSNEYPALIFRYSDAHCNPCYENALEQLRLSFDSTANIVILNSHRSSRDFKVFKKANNVIHKNYFVPYDAFEWKIEEYGIPYFFYTTSD